MQTKLRREGVWRLARATVPIPLMLVEDPNICKSAEESFVRLIAYFYYYSILNFISHQFVDLLDHNRQYP